ncbi:MAG: acyl-CoA dehydrogenase family protein [Xanthobacteraceae bacterium]
MYDLHLTPEQLEFRDTVRDFVNDEIKPVTLKAERLDVCDRSLPLDVLRKASQMGLRTLALPEELGNVGADALTCCIVTEELAVGDADVAAVLMETSALGRLLFAAMTPQQRERLLPSFLEDDDYHLALADHEPGGDTALGVNYHRPAAMERPIATVAKRSSGDFVISGSKDCVANAPLARLIAVQARTDDGPALILVPRNTPGLTVTEQPEPRWYHGACGTLVLKDCRVPADNLLGIAVRPDVGRSAPLYQALNLGIGRAAYEAALEYAQLRVQGGRRLIEHQAIGTRLADIAIRLDIARNTIWRAAWASDHPEAVADRSLPDLPLTVIAQVFTSETIYRVTKDAAECFGAMGVMRDMPLQKYIHDALICLHTGDGNADLRLQIAEGLANYRRRPSMLAAE